MATVENPLGEVLEALGQVLGDMPGLVRWFDQPPENMSEFPCAMAWVREGEIGEVSAGLSRGLHTVYVDIFQARTVLPEAIEKANGWPYRVFRRLQDNATLNGTVAAIVWPMRHRAGPMTYANGDAPYDGVRCEVSVKVLVE